MTDIYYPVIYAHDSREHQRRISEAKRILKIFFWKRDMKTVQVLLVVVVLFVCGISLTVAKGKYILKFMYICMYYILFFWI